MWNAVYIKICLGVFDVECSLYQNSVFVFHVCFSNWNFNAIFLWL